MDKDAKRLMRCLRIDKSRASGALHWLNKSGVTEIKEIKRLKEGYERAALVTDTDDVGYELVFDQLGFLQFIRRRDTGKFVFFKKM